jgi:hypothetical protein
LNVLIRDLGSEVLPLRGLPLLQAADRLAGSNLVVPGTSRAEFTAALAGVRAAVVAEMDSAETRRKDQIGAAPLDPVRTTAALDGTKQLWRNERALLALLAGTPDRAVPAREANDGVVQAATCVPRVWLTTLDDMEAWDGQLLAEELVRIEGSAVMAKVRDSSEVRQVGIEGLLGEVMSILDEVDPTASVVIVHQRDWDIERALGLPTFGAGDQFRELAEDPAHWAHQLSPAVAERVATKVSGVLTVGQMRVPLVRDYSAGEQEVAILDLGRLRTTLHVAEPEEGFRAWVEEAGTDPGGEPTLYIRAECAEPQLAKDPSGAVILSIEPRAAPIDG